MRGMYLLNTKAYVNERLISRPNSKTLKQNCRRESTRYRTSEQRA